MRYVVPFLIGILFAYFLPQLTPFTIPIWWMCGAMGVLVLLLILFHHWKATKAFGYATTLFCVVLGTLAFELKYQSLSRSIEPTIHHLKGVVQDALQRKTKTWATRIETDEGASVLCYLNLTGNNGDTLDAMSIPQIGDTLSVYTYYGLTMTADALHHVADSHSEDDGFEYYRKYLFLHDVVATCYANKWSMKTGHPRGLMGIRRWLKAYSQQMRDVAMAQSDSEEMSIVMAMTIGDKSGVDKTMREQYARAGVSHILALSGFHLGIIYMILQFMLGAWVGKPRWQRIIRLVCILMVWCFVAVTGAPPSLVRAAIMFSVLMLAEMVRRKIRMIDVLCVTGMVMLCVNPFLLFDVGFELSMMSMLGLLTLGQQLWGWWGNHRIRFGTKWLSFVSFTIDFIVGSAITTIVCSLFTLPLTTYYFGIVPLLSIFSNIIISGLAFFLMVVAVVWWMVCWLPQIQSMFSILLLFLAGMLNDVTAWISSMKWGVLEWHPNELGVILCYLLIGVVMKLFRPGRNNVITK